MLEINNPKLKTKKGFVQISKDNKVVDVNNLKINDTFDIVNNKVKISALALSKENIGYN